LQTPPATTFFSAFTSRLKRVVQQITSPRRERQFVERTNLIAPSGVELQNLSNSESPFEDSNFLGDRGIRNLFPTPSLPLPIDLSYPIIDEQFNGLPAIVRPIEEAFASPLNQSFLNNSPFTPPYLNNQIPSEIDIGSVNLYLVEGIEQFQSPGNEFQSVKTQVNKDKNQVENKGIRVKGVDVLLLGTSLPTIITSDIIDENAVRRETGTSY
jgi:hypothetical protein